MLNMNWCSTHVRVHVSGVAHCNQRELSSLFSKGWGGGGIIFNGHLKCWSTAKKVWPVLSSLNFGY